MNLLCTFFFLLFHLKIFYILAVKCMKDTFSMILPARKCVCVCVCLFVHILVHFGADVKLGECQRLKQTVGWIVAQLVGWLVGSFICRNANAVCVRIEPLVAGRLGVCMRVTAACVPPYVRA